MLGNLVEFFVEIWAKILEMISEFFASFCDSELQRFRSWYPLDCVIYVFYINFWLLFDFWAIFLLTASVSKTQNFRFSPEFIITHWGALYNTYKNYLHYIMTYDIRYFIVNGLLEVEFFLPDFITVYVFWAVSKNPDFWVHTNCKTAGSWVRVCNRVSRNPVSLQLLYWVILKYETQSLDYSETAAFCCDISIFRCFNDLYCTVTV